MFTGTLRVKLVEAVDLRPTDFQRRHNVGLAGKLVESTIDPYVFIDIDEVHVHRTTTKQKTFCPRWEETFQSEVQSGTNLGLTVFHDAAIPPDDFVANCSISFDELINITKDHSDIWVCESSSIFLHAMLKTLLLFGYGFMNALIVNSSKSLNVIYLKIHASGMKISSHIETFGL